MPLPETEEFGPLPLPLAPRRPQQPADAMGPKVFRHLGASVADRVPAEEMDRLAADAEKLGDDQKAKELTEAMEGAVNGIVRKMRGEVSFRRVR